MLTDRSMTVHYKVRVIMIIESFKKELLVFMESQLDELYEHYFSKRPEGENLISKTFVKLLDLKPIVNAERNLHSSWALRSRLWLNQKVSVINNAFTIEYLMFETRVCKKVLGGDVLNGMLVEDLVDTLMDIRMMFKSEEHRKERLVSKLLMMIFLALLFSHNYVGFKSRKERMSLGVLDEIERLTSLLPPEVKVVAFAYDTLLLVRDPRASYHKIATLKGLEGDYPLEVTQMSDFIISTDTAFGRISDQIGFSYKRFDSPLLEKVHQEFFSELKQNKEVIYDSIKNRNEPV